MCSVFSVFIVTIVVFSLISFICVEITGLESGLFEYTENIVIVIIKTNEQTIKNTFSLFNIIHPFILISTIFYQIYYISSIKKAVAKQQRLFVRI